jgi:1,4-alpha-glucan branching enzyme
MAGVIEIEHSLLARDLPATALARSRALPERLTIPISGEHIHDSSTLGANLVAGGAIFRVWAPAALDLHVQVADRGDVINTPGNPFTVSADTRLLQQANGYWAGFKAGVRDGDHYRFYVVGPGSTGYKRDPYARELEFYDYPNVDCIVRDPNRYPWHDAGFRTPPFHEAIIYQFHVGTYYATDAAGRDMRADRVAKLLDAIDRIRYWQALGVNFVQPLPIVEFEGPRSLGYNGTDIFSPEMDYCVREPELDFYLAKVNALLADRGQPPLARHELEGQVNQLKAFVDLCHLYGIAVLFDVVYNHAGGFGNDDQSLFFFDRNHPGDNNRSLYFTDRGWAGGLVFAYWQQPVCQFLIDNARFFLDEYHVDGFRYDEVTVIDHHGGWQFCQDLTSTLRYHRPGALHIAEYWADQPAVIRDTESGGAGFDAVVYSGLRGAVRSSIAQAAHGRDAQVNLEGVRDQLRRPGGFNSSWRAVQHLENHDRQRVNNTTDREPRVAALADPSNARSWYARSRARVANGLLLTAPGIPAVFMGQEFLEDKYWSDNPAYYKDNLLWWDGLQHDSVMRDHLRFMSDLIWLRRKLPALSGEGINPYYVHNDNRVLAFHRWVEWEGKDVVVVASLNESTFWSYDLCLPIAGHWHEVFNSDVYDNWVNPWTAGNGGSVWANPTPRDGLPASATIVIPANGLIVLSREPV